MDNIQDLAERVVRERRAQNRLTAVAIVILGFLLAISLFFLYEGEQRSKQLDSLENSLKSDRVCIVINEDNLHDFTG